MKISQVSFSKLGGAGAVARQLSKEMDKLGHESTLTTFSEFNLRTDPLSRPVTTLMAGIDEYLVKKKKRTPQFSLLREFMRSCKSFGPLPDIVNLHWVTGVLSFEQIQRLGARGVGIFWTLHDMRPFTGGCHHSGDCNNFMESCTNCPQSKSFFHSLVKLNLTNKFRYSFLPYATIVAPSSWIAEAAKNSSLFGNSRIVIIPNPIDSVFFSAETFFPRQRLAASKLVCCLIATNLDDLNKRVAEVCEAVSALAASNPFADVKLLLVGAGGELFSDKYPFVARLGALHATDIVQVLNTVDVNISFSFAETSPLSIAECAARGVPTIASNNKGSAEIIKSLGCGVTVEDSQHLFRSLEKALLNMSTLGVTGMGSDLMVEKATSYHEPGNVAARYAHEYVTWKIDN